MNSTSLDNSVLSVSLNPSSATVFVSRTHRNTTEKLVQSYTANFEKVRETNLLSIAASRKLKTAINWLAYLSREKTVFVKSLNKHVKTRLTFITLTLPTKQIHTDTEIKEKCLGPFLQWLRDKHKATKYIWKAEIQKNGNIHFHITTDKFIHYQALRKQWNRNLDQLGYCKRYTSATGRINPPSTEIKSVRKVKNIAAYLGSYLSGTKASSGKKSNQEYNNRIIGGRLWGVSSYLTRLKNPQITEENSNFNELLKYLAGTAYGQFRTDYTTTFFISHEILDEICDVFTDVLGFDWLISSGLDFDDIGICCPSLN